MLKKKLPLIFILFLGSLVLITYSIQNNLINLSNSEKLINIHSNSNYIKELDLLPIELDSES